MKKLTLITFLLSITLLSGFTPSEFNYLPDNVNDHQIIEYTQFTLSYNEQHEQADWVAYELTGEEVAMKLPRCNCFKSDTNVITISSSTGDYKLSGYDKGHLSPAADNNMSDTANRESFLMSNMSPQLPKFNRGIWKSLESWVRKKATEHKSVYVVTGPVFISNLGAIGENNVTVPGYYYKVLLRMNNSKIRTIAFLIPQQYTTSDIKDYIVTVNRIETITGIDFFPELDNSIENKIESQSQPKKWGL